jgi:hypothetical protein
MSAPRIVRLALAFVVISTIAVAAQQGPPPAPKPGPEHEVLKMDVGTWDAVVELAPAPGAPAGASKSKGVETNRIGCGGLCLITDFKADMMGMPFEGHGVTTWDPAKKKYIGSWTDSLSTGLAIGESTYDAKGKKWSGTMEGPDMTGNVVKSRAVGEWRDANTRVFTMYSAGPDGKEAQSMKITYTKRK